MLQEVGDDPSDEKVKEFVLNTLKGGVNINIVFFFLSFFFSRDVRESKTSILSGEHALPVDKDGKILSLTSKGPTSLQ